MRFLLRWVGMAPAGVVLVGIASRVSAAQPVLAASAFGAIALGVATVGLRRHGPCHGSDWRRAWRLLIVGLAASVVGNLARTLLGGAFPSPADGLALAGRVCTAAGLLGLVHLRLSGRAVDFLFEAVMVALSIGLLVWAFAIEPAGAAGPHPAVKTLALVMVVVDIAVVWLAVRMVSLTASAPAAYRYLIAGLAVLLTADALVAGAAVGGVAIRPEALGSLRIWAGLLAAVAAAHPSHRLPFEPVPPSSAHLRGGHVALAVVGLLLGPGLFVERAVRGEPLSLAVVLAGSTLLPLAVAVYLIQQVQHRALAEYLAQHDALTGLPNGVLFSDRLETALASARRSGRGLAVMFLDLDRFKSINDSLGHEPGNQLLQGVGRRLRTCLREEDSVARMGGDEFTLLLPNVTDADDAAAVAAKVLDEFAKPFSVAGRELFTTASIGVACFPDDGEDAATLLKNADTAMYRAKARGRATYEPYTADMSVRAQIKLSMESSLRRVVERGELALHYQPKVDVKAGRIVGLEALVRWSHPKLGLVPPAAFIPVAEETGLIISIEEWVIGTACRQLRAWVDSGLAVVPVAVNLSARHFARGQVEALVEDVLRDTGIDPALLELEITESVLMHDLNAIGTTLDRLRAIGVRCSIDDFGTGFSGLNYLAQLPIDSLKIDQSFVRQIGPHQVEAPIVEAVIALAHSLRMNVIAEGVETTDQAIFLRDHGCEQIQGFLYSRPLPADEVEHLLMIEAVTRVPGDPRFIETLEEARFSVDGRRDATGGCGIPSRRHDRGTSLLVDLAHGLVAPEETARPLDARAAEGVLAALRSEERSLAPAGRPLRSLVLRLGGAALAGLMPLSLGLAAAGALPPAAQSVASEVLRTVGVNVPGVGADSATVPPQSVPAIDAATRRAAP